jgi:tetratricopeptide (TPR) repeat protein
MLVVLDNAVSAEQVRPLLPGATGCLVLVTSRNRLTGLVVAEGAHPVTLDLLTDAEARQLLVARLGTDRVRADEHAVESITAHCARLPLALAVVAARAAIHPTFPLGALAAQLAEAGPLGVLASQDSGTDVRAVFSWSYERLELGPARLFRRLGLHSGPHTATAAAASLVGQPVPAVRELLAELTRAHLVIERSPGRFVMHDLLRAYAVELSATADPFPVRHAAVVRMLDHYLHSADRAAGQLYPHRYRIPLLPASRDVSVEPIADRDAALAWFGAEHRNLISAVEQAAAADLVGHTWQLATTIGIFVDRQGRWDDWISALRTALFSAGRLSDTIGQAHAHSGLGLARSRMRQYDEARGHLERALALFVELDDHLGQAYAHLRMSSVCGGLGRPADALAQAQRALSLYSTSGHKPGLAQALNNIGWFQTQLGDHREALRHCEQALALHRELGDRQGAAHTLDSLGHVHHQLGDFDRAARHHEESAQMLADTGDRTHEALALTHLGDAHHAAGHRHRARHAWEVALGIFDELGHPESDRVMERLHGLGAFRHAFPRG